jgi:hypothetical protein
MSSSYKYITPNLSLLLIIRIAMSCTILPQLYWEIIGSLHNKIQGDEYISKLELGEGDQSQIAVILRLCLWMLIGRFN